MIILDYYFTPLSPWTYLGHDRVLALAKRTGITLVAKPIDLGAKIFPQSGGLPFAQRPAQRLAYRLIELARWRDFLVKPLTLKPKFFPVSDSLALKTIAALQAIASASNNNHDLSLAIAGDIMKATWVDEKDASDQTVLDGICRNHGVDLEQLADARAVAQSQLDINNADAISANVFGAPWFVLKNTKLGSNADQHFWGQDRIDFLERAVAQMQTQAQAQT